MPKSCPHNSLYLQIKSGKIKVTRNSPVEQRFWNRVNKKGPLHPVLKTRCWLWEGSKFAGGYAQMSFEGQTKIVHRYSWELHYRFIPEGICVLHKCDNRQCTNPKHLFLGTHQDNMRDMIEKGRNISVKGDNHYSRRYPERLPRGGKHYSRTNPEKLARGDRHGSRTRPERLNPAKGESHPKAKLTESDVLEIRRLWKVTPRKCGLGVELAKRFNVSNRAISSIVNRISWRHI